MDNEINKNEYEYFYLIFGRNKKTMFFINKNIKIKLIFFSHNKLNFNLEPTG